MYAIQNIKTNQILEWTCADDEEKCWNLYLGFEAIDDQWSWQQEKAIDSGNICVKVELIKVSR